MLLFNFEVPMIKGPERGHFTRHEAKVERHEHVDKRAHLITYELTSVMNTFIHMFFTNTVAIHKYHCESFTHTNAMHKNQYESFTDANVIHRYHCKSLTSSNAMRMFSLKSFMNMFKNTYLMLALLVSAHICRTLRTLIGFTYTMLTHARKHIHV